MSDQDETRDIPAAAPVKIKLPPGTVEAVAKAMYEAPQSTQVGMAHLVWDQASEQHRDWARTLARVAITEFIRQTGAGK